EDGIRDDLVTGVQTCALPISSSGAIRCNLRWSAERGAFLRIRLADQPHGWMTLLPQSYGTIVACNQRHPDIECRAKLNQPVPRGFNQRLNVAVDPVREPVPQRNEN